MKRNNTNVDRDITTRAAHESLTILILQHTREIKDKETRFWHLSRNYRKIAILFFE
jgi:hypothetical protein